MEKYSEFHGLEGLVWRDLGRMFGPESEWDESDDGFERDDADLHDSDIPGSEMTGGRADPGEFADAESSADTAAHVLGNPPWHLEGGTSLGWNLQRADGQGIEDGRVSVYAHARAQSADHREAVAPPKVAAEDCLRTWLPKISAERSHRRWLRKVAAEHGYRSTYVLDPDCAFEPESPFESSFEFESEFSSLSSSPVIRSRASSRDSRTSERWRA